MRREALALLVGLSFGLAGGLAWRTQRAAAAEARAERADSLYQAERSKEVIAQRERDAFDQLRALAQSRADSVAHAAEDSVSAVRARAARTTAHATTALAAAQTLRDTAETWHGLYTEAAAERDDALAAFVTQQQATGELRAIVAQDSVELGKERERTSAWKRTADSLDLANAELMNNRRPSFNVKLTAGSFFAGVLTATGVCVATKRCG